MRHADAKWNTKLFDLIYKQFNMDNPMTVNQEQFLTRGGTWVEPENNEDGGAI